MFKKIYHGYMNFWVPEGNSQGNCGMTQTHPKALTIARGQEPFGRWICSYCWPSDSMKKKLHIFSSLVSILGRQKCMKHLRNKNFNKFDTTHCVHQLSTIRFVPSVGQSIPNTAEKWSILTSISPNFLMIGIPWAIDEKIWRSRPFP